MPAPARADRVLDVLTPSTSGFPFVHSQALNLFPPDARRRPPFLFARFRDRGEIFQPPSAVDRSAGAIFGLLLQLPHRWPRGKSPRILAELRLRGRAPTTPRARAAKEQPRAEDSQLR